MGVIFSSNFQENQSHKWDLTSWENGLQRHFSSCFRTLCYSKKEENAARKVIQRHLHSKSRIFKGARANSDPVGGGQPFLWTAWKIPSERWPLRGQTTHLQNNFRKKKRLAPALAHWRHRKMTFPRDWSQPNEPISH